MKVVLVLLIYFGLTVAAAFASPWVTQTPSMLIWVFSTVLLFAALLVLVKGLFPTASIELRLAARFLTASVVTFIAAFVDFVVMVNIWEDLGFGL